MNPLVKIDHAEAVSAIPLVTVKKIRNRMKYVLGGIARVEKASSLNYPDYYVEPVLPLSSSRSDIGNIGILYSRTIPVRKNEGIRIQIELSAPLVAYGIKSTIEAVLAHEFLHYVELVRKFSRLDVASEEISASLFESAYSDKDRLFNAKLLFRDTTLLRLVEKRFSNGFTDNRLDLKTVKMWIQKKLPQVAIPPESNVVRIPISLLLSTKFDPNLSRRLNELEGEST